MVACISTPNGKSVKLHTHISKLNRDYIESYRALSINTVRTVKLLKETQNVWALDLKI
jgi:hypothetical protein